MSELVTAEQIEAFRTNGFVVIDDLLTDAELDTFEPLVTAAVAYRCAGDERTLEEGGAGGSPVVPAATHAVDENDVLDLGHTTKGDSHSAQASPKRVCRLCRQRVGLSGPASAPAPPFELVGYRLNTACTRRFCAVTRVSRCRRAWGPPDMGGTGTAGGKPPAAS